MMGFGLIFFVLIFGAVAYTLGWRPQFYQNRLASNDQTPLEVLKSRYARGEISREEYEQMHRDLEN